MKNEKIFIKILSQKEIIATFSNILNFQTTEIVFQNIENEEKSEINVDRLSFNQVKDLLEKNESKFLKITSAVSRQERDDRN